MRINQFKSIHAKSLIKELSQSINEESNQILISYKISLLCSVIVITTLPQARKIIIFFFKKKDENRGAPSKQWAPARIRGRSSKLFIWHLDLWKSDWRLPGGKSEGSWRRCRRYHDSGKVLHYLIRNISWFTWEQLGVHYLERVRGSIFSFKLKTCQFGQDN